MSSKFSKVIELAVIDNCDGSGFVPNRLATAGDVDDAQAAHPAGDGRSDQNAFIVGATMHHRGNHSANESFAIISRLNADDPTDPAHGCFSPALSTTRIPSHMFFALYGESKRSLSGRTRAARRNSRAQSPVRILYWVSLSGTTE